MKHLMTREERRVATDRRRFSYAAYVPERRSGMDRRELKVTQTNRKVVYG